MKSHYLWAGALILLSACATQDTPRAASTSPRNTDMRCVGGSFDRNFCVQYANQRCAAGFEVFEKEAAEEDGVVRRAYYFKCIG